MAQRRRKELQMKRRQRMITALCIAGGAGAMVLSLVICILVFNPFAGMQTDAAPTATSLPYDTAQPFTINDLTGAQLSQIRTKGRMTVSDGPRGVSIGDSLEKLLEKYPATFTGTSQSGGDAAVMQTDEAILAYCTDYLQNQSSGEITGLQSDEEIILYCADYFQNQNGKMTALPPRGLVNTDGGQTTVTLLAPTSAYPPGTRDNYGSYEHIYCVYTIEPVTMTVSSIILGIDQ